MVRIHTFAIALVAALMMLVPARASEQSAEIEQLKKDIEQLRQQLESTSTAMPKSPVDKALESKYGPNATVTTRTGKLTIGGLLQVWYYSIANDNKGMFDDPANTGIPDTNECSDNDSFRIRRSEIRFTMDIHENVTAVVMIDPAREALSFPSLPDNKVNSGLLKSRNNVAPEFDESNGPDLGSTAAVSRVQSGAGGVPRLLQDAYIEYHGVVPHHDFTVGQFKPKFGEEGPRSSSQLDFIERSFVGQAADARDLGMAIHGFWWDDRFQYWLALMDGAGNYFGTAGQMQNRSDDNDEKDYLATVMVRPLWKNETWGSIELGYSFQGGKKGESSAEDPVNSPINGLNRNRNWALRHAAWASYLPGGPVRGWWLRGEWAYIKDRNAPNTVVDLLGAGNSIGGYEQTDGNVVSTTGWYFATGYKLSDSVFADSCPSWLKPWEFTFRYQTMGNVMVADLGVPAHTDVFKTNVWTAGVNYYIKGHNAKIQANYNWVDEDDDNSNRAARGFREVRNDNLMINFQVAF